MRRGLLAAVLSLSLLPLLACGPSESEQAAKPGAGAGMQDKPASPADSEAAKQTLLSLVVWDSSEPARDLDADGQVCSDKVLDAANAKRGSHPLVSVQRWIQCMEELGWSQKKKS